MNRGKIRIALMYCRLVNNKDNQNYRQKAMSGWPISLYRYLFKDAA